MSTNFYWDGHEDSEEIEHHIGLRSGAGLYC